MVISKLNLCWILLARAKNGIKWPCAMIGSITMCCCSPVPSLITMIYLLNPFPLCLCFSKINERDLRLEIIRRKWSGWMGLRQISTKKLVENTSLLQSIDHSVAKSGSLMDDFPEISSFFRIHGVLHWPFRQLFRGCSRHSDSP